MTKNNLPKNFFNILTKAVEEKTYGSIEIYFEEGNITQITQRIINKVRSDKRVDGVSSMRSL